MKTRLLLAVVLAVAGCVPSARVFMGTSTLVPVSGGFTSTTVTGAVYTVYRGDMKDELVFQYQDSAWSATEMGQTLTFASGQTFSIASGTTIIEKTTLTAGTGTLGNDHLQLSLDLSREGGGPSGMYTLVFDGTRQ